jgi:hypothetical protein
MMIFLRAAEVIMNTYSSIIEQQMQRFYQSLNERDRRRYAAIEAVKLGHGGMAYVSGVLGCDPSTIAKGVKELEGEELETSRQRQKGGGRKPLSQTNPQMMENFLDVLGDHTAGDPMRAGVKWTNLSRRQIAAELKARGTPASKDVVSRLLRDHGYRRRKPQKKTYDG